MYFDLADDIYVKRNQSSLSVEGHYGGSHNIDYRYINEYERKENSKFALKRAMYALSVIASPFATIAGVAASAVGLEEGRRIIKLFGVTATISSIAAFIYSVKRLINISTEIHNTLELLKDNSLKIRQFIILNLE